MLRRMLRILLISVLSLMISLSLPVSTMGIGRTLDTAAQDLCSPALWNTRVNGTVTTSPHSNERITASAVDSNGNLYVTGWSTGIAGRYADFVTIKYNSSGQQQWIYDYTTPYLSKDSEGWAIAVDPGGNVYAGGHSADANGAIDFIVIKFPSNYQQGNAPGWIRTYDGPGKGNDQLFDIAIDSNGNVYATGWGKGIGTSNDYTTISYDTNGNQRWVARYDGQEPGGADDRAYAIAVDATGDVYVTGRSDHGASLLDFVTIKYNGRTGQPVDNWGDHGINIYNGPGNAHDQAVSIVLDEAGAVYVTGYSQGIKTGYDYATIKYAGDNGEPMWSLSGQPGVPSGANSIAARYNGPGNGNDQPAPPATSAAPGAFGSYITNNQGIVVTTELIAGGPTPVVYVSGQSERLSGNTDFATIKYNGRTGLPLWDFGERAGGGMTREVAARYNGPADATDRVWALALASDGGVYVTGPSMALGAAVDFATIKYSSTGEMTWLARYNGPANNADQSTSLAVWHDPSNIDWIYVTGQSFGIDSHGRGTNGDYCTIKYNGLTGVPAWTLVSQPGAPPDKPGTPANIAARFDVESSSSVDHAADIAVANNSGNIYVTGAMGPFGNYDFVTIAYSGKDGSLLWTGLPGAMDRLDGTSKLSDVGTAIALDAAGNVYVTGTSTNANGVQNDSDYATTLVSG